MALLVHVGPLMGNAEKSNTYYHCHFCSNSVLVPHNHTDTINCDRCGHSSEHLKPRSATATFVFSLTALIFYIPAMVFPFMTIELYGNRNTSTIWSGIVSLIQAGSWPIGAIVFLASMFIPVLKLAILFYLSLTAKNKQRAYFKTRLYHFVEAIGRWSMLDIFLLAVLVAIMKLGPWTTVRPEPAALMFALVVIFTMLASAYFDPKILWSSQDDEFNQ